MTDGIIAVCLAAYCAVLIGLMLWQERVRQIEEDRHYQAERDLRERKAKLRALLKSMGVDAP